MPSDVARLRVSGAMTMRFDSVMGPSVKGSKSLGVAMGYSSEVLGGRVPPVCHGERQLGLHRTKVKGVDAVFVIP
ncbi:hypothetical protein Sa4125_13360 [Aureimonas sp. SA4125]|nr:hypothetical protein Sa4125_13360 [Aureimonas sp. SA4125]